MMTRRIKVAYICHFSNKEITARLPLKLDLYSRLVLFKNHLPQTTEVKESAVWNTNAINELKKYSDSIELHVISPHAYLRDSIFEYENEGVHYHFYRNDDDTLLLSVFRRFLHRECNYIRTRDKVKRLITTIKPDIVHVVGAENPQYSLCTIDIPECIPVLCQLQTLMSDPKFERSYRIRHSSYLHRAKVEQSVIERSNYLGSTVDHFIHYVKHNIKPEAIFVKTVLALVEPVNLKEEDKLFDFVYFSVEISKAADLAIDAFIMATRKHPNITLKVIGGYTMEYKTLLESRLSKENLLQNVTFAGSLPSHQDVINEIRHSRFALLPLKIDYVSGTIRESLANGLPVVTTITEGTPTLNINRETVLLSKIGDSQAMADNMCRLIEDPELVETLRTNGADYMNELDSNYIRVKRYVDIYHAILNHFHKGIPITEDLLS